MPTTTSSIGFTQDAFDAFLATRDEPDWLMLRRRDAFARFLAQPLPARNEEEWMRTDIRMLRLEKFSLPTSSASCEGAGGEIPPGPPSADLSATGLLTVGVELGGQVVAHNSHAVSARLDDATRKQGVLFGSLDELVREHGELVKQRLFTAVTGEADKFAMLQAACWTGGTLLYVPRGVSVEKPLHSLSAISNGGVDLGRTLVVLEDGASATLLAETAGGDAGGFHAGAIELFVGPNARLQYVNLQNWGAGVWHFAHQKGVVDRDGSIQWTIGALGARLAKVNQHVALVGPGATAQVNGVMFTEGKQHLAYHTLQHHRAPSCRSDLLYKGALQDHSRVVWRGMIKVDPGAQKTDGYQRNDNLMLSESARADSIPGLEIEAHDVRCTHGSTTGRVDDEQVFYARSRGLTRKEATRMIVAGFFQQVFDRIRLEPVREALGQAIGRRVREV